MTGPRSLLDTSPTAHDQSAIRNPQPAIASRRLRRRPLRPSFELFPPKTDKGEEALRKHVAKLVEFGPSYITCTYGAGGSTRDKTLAIVAQVKQQHGLPVASHLT